MFIDNYFYNRRFVWKLLSFMNWATHVLARRHSLVSWAKLRMTYLAKSGGRLTWGQASVTDYCRSALHVQQYIYIDNSPDLLWALVLVHCRGSTRVSLRLGHCSAECLTSNISKQILEKATLLLNLTAVGSRISLLGWIINKRWAVLNKTPGSSVSRTVDSMVST